MIRSAPFALVAWLLAPMAAAQAQGSPAYFPPTFTEATETCEGPFGPRRQAVVSAAEAEWYSRQWRAADEPSLYLASQDRGAPRAWRFTWLRSFHSPLFVRIEEDRSGGLRLIAKELTGMGG